MKLNVLGLEGAINLTHGQSALISTLPLQEPLRLEAILVNASTELKPCY